MEIEKILEAGAEKREPKVMEEWSEILEDLMEEVCFVDKDLYDKYWREFYLSVFGPHLTKECATYWVSEMHNEDGTKGQHWTIEQTTQVAKQYGVNFDKYNADEWYAVMNMIYSDFYGAIPNDVSVYVKMSQKWLNDKDVPEGKLFYYYHDVVKAHDN